MRHWHQYEDRAVARVLVVCAPEEEHIAGPTQMRPSIAPVVPPLSLCHSPVKRRFLGRPRLLTRIYPLLARRGISRSISVSLILTFVSCSHPRTGL
jgi:hypothetical protein